MRLSSRFVFIVLTIVPLGLVAAGVFLGKYPRLQPCYLCNFQRLLYLMLAAFALGGVFSPRIKKLWSFFFGLTALGGVLVALQQSWMQYAPEQTTECGFSDPTLIERLVDWLGALWPSMFMVTGFCKDKELVFFGLSLANLSGVCFLGLTLVASWQFFRRAPK